MLAAFFRKLLRRLARRRLTVALDRHTASFAIGQQVGAHLVRRWLPWHFIIAACAVKFALEFLAWTFFFVRTPGMAW